MKYIAYVVTVMLLATVLPAVARAQSSTSSTEPTGQKTLAATMDVYVYPTGGVNT